MFLLLLAACDEPAEAPAASPFDTSWVATIVREPARFEALAGADRTGWAALHRNDWAAAAAGTGPAARRAAAELAVLHAILAGVSNEAWLALGSRWEARGGFPTQSVLPRLLVAAARDAGDATAEAHWSALGGRDDDAVKARLALHAAVRAGSAPVATLTALATRPLLEEPLADGPRPWWDPMLHLTLANAWGRTAAEGYPTDALEASIFSGQFDPSDGSPAASLAHLGLTMPALDEVEACRETARGFDAALQAWWTGFARGATPEGAALAADLKLVDGLRSRALVDWAVDALESNRPRCALALAEVALDHTAPRAITPVNAPTLFAVLAQANLRTGHTREALDALEVLTAPFPETTGLDETLGDLAVLSGLDRAGDSREN